MDQILLLFAWSCLVALMTRIFPLSRRLDLDWRWVMILTAWPKAVLRRLITSLAIDLINYESQTQIEWDVEHHLIREGIFSCPVIVKSTNLDDMKSFLCLPLPPLWGWMIHDRGWKNMSGHQYIDHCSLYMTFSLRSCSFHLLSTGWNQNLTNFSTCDNFDMKILKHLIRASSRIKNSASGKYVVLNNVIWHLFCLAFQSFPKSCWLVSQA